MLWTVREEGPHKGGIDQTILIDRALPILLQIFRSPGCV